MVFGSKSQKNNQNNLQRGKAAFPPPCARLVGYPLSRGAQPPQHCKRMVERAWVQYSWTKTRSQIDQNGSQKIDQKSIENSSKINQKSSKNRSKIDQKSIKNRSTSRPGGGLGGFWQPSASWEASWDFLEAFWGVLEASLAVLARKSWPTWLQLGSQNGAKIDKNSKLKSIKNQTPLGIRFWEDFGGFGEGKWSQVGTKIASKMDLIL